MRHGTALAILSGLLIGCTPTAVEKQALDPAFSEAARQSDVPRDLLVAIAYSQSRLDDRGGELAEDGSAGVMGLLESPHLDGPSLTHAATLIGQSPADVALDSRLNILAAAAALRFQGDQWEAETGLELHEVADWAEIVGWYAGGEDAGMQRSYTREVIGWIESGLVAQTPDGETIAIEPKEIDAPWLNFQPVSGSSGDYSGNANFVQAHSSNYTHQSRSASDIDMIVVHTAQGSYSGTAYWFADSRANASAHYVIRSSDGEVTQMVYEEDKAWHGGHGTTNSRSVGIELEGYIESPSTYYTDAMYGSLATLIVDISRRQGVALDRNHIIGHNEVPGCAYTGGGGASCHTDPGSGFDWDKLMSKVNGISGGGSSGSGDSSGGASSGSTTATGTLYGFVRENSIYSGNGISGATVTTSTGLSTTTNANGLYTFEGLDAGYLTLSVTASGYRTASGEEEVLANHTNWESIALSSTGGPSGTPENLSPSGWDTVYGPSVTLDWNGVSGAAYEVKIYFYNGGNWEYYYAYNTGSSPEKMFWPSVNDTYYAFSVRAKGGDGSSEWSDKNYFYFDN